MTSGVQPKGLPSTTAACHACSPAVSLGELAILAIMAGMLTLLASLCYPVWDDGWLELALRSKIDLVKAMSDRPVLGHWWQFSADHGLVFTQGVVLYAITWFLVGLATLSMWKYLFPQMSRYGLVPAILCMAPAIVAVQWILINLSLCGLTGCAVTLLAIVQLLKCGQIQSSVLRAGTIVICLAAIGGMILISEYPISTAAGGAVLILGAASFNSFRSRFALATAVAVVVVGSYAVYHQTVDAQARSEVRPESRLSGTSLWHLKVIPFRLADMIWQATFGQPLDALGQLNFGQFASIPSFAFGVLLAAFFLAVVWGRDNPGSMDDDAALNAWRNLLLLFFAIALALLPMVLMGRILRGSESSTRFLMSVMPFSACFAVRLMLGVIRARYRTMMAAVVLCLCGTLTCYGGISRVNGRRMVASWGKQLDKMLPTSERRVAIVNFDWSQLNGEAPADYELTAQLTETWNQEKAGQFWAYPSWIAAKQLSNLNPSGKTPPEIMREVRGVGLNGPVHELIIINLGRTDQPLNADNVTRWRFD